MEGRDSGDETVLAPLEGAKRCEVATLIMRFCISMLPGEGWIFDY